jgi:microsomal dipeptidase-like Zn-dependent dipeptidase
VRKFGKWLGRLLVLALLGLGGTFVFAPGFTEKARNQVIDHTPFPVSQAAQTLHDSLVIGDWHADSLLWNRNLNKRGSYGQVDFPRLAQGNVALQVFTAVTKSPKGLNYDHNDPDAFDNIKLVAFLQLWPPRTWNSILERALYQSEKLHDFQAAAPDSFTIIRSKFDLETLLAARARGENRIGALLGIEGAHPLEGNIENLDLIEQAGYRVIALQHFFDNELGGTLHSRENAGLTAFGRQVVAEVAKRPMVLDLAHSSLQVVRDVLDITSMPVIVSHSGIHSHCKTRRNIPDDLMLEIAGRGGVIGIGFWAEAACTITPDGVAASIKAGVDLVGEDHISLGSDFDGSVITGFDTSELAALTDALLRAGLTPATIRKVMGENMLRVLRARLE